MRWFATPALAALAALGSPGHAAAQSCQASGSSPIFPAQTSLSKGDIFDVLVCVRNTSSTTPMPLVPDVAGALLGTTTVNLACAESFCMTMLPGTLTFVPGPADGCVSKLPGVASCQVNALDVNQVEIDMESGGILLGPNALVCFAEFRVEVTAPALTDTAGKFFMQPFTGGADIQTDDAACPVPATGSASGSVALFSPGICEVGVDRQVSCDGGVSFVDAGFGDAITEACVAPQNGQVVVRYLVRNAGDVDVTCLSPTGGLSDSNPGVLAGVVEVGVLGPGVELVLPDDDDQTCDEVLVAGEPGTATLTCRCEKVFVGETRTDMDTAAFSCESAKMGCTWR